MFLIGGMGLRRITSTNYSRFPMLMTPSIYLILNPFDYGAIKLLTTVFETLDTLPRGNVSDFHEVFALYDTRILIGDKYYPCVFEFLRRLGLDFYLTGEEFCKTHENDMLPFLEFEVERWNDTVEIEKNKHINGKSNGMFWEHYSRCLSSIFKEHFPNGYRDWENAEFALEKEHAAFLSKIKNEGYNTDQRTSENLLDFGIGYSKSNRQVWNLRNRNSQIRVTESQWPIFIGAVEAVKNNSLTSLWYDSLIKNNKSISGKDRALAKRLRENLKSVGVTLNNSDYMLASYDVERDESS